MKNSITNITNELQSKGIKTTGSYSTIPQMVSDSIDTIKHFGKDYFLNQTTLGKLVIEIIFSLELKDKRKSVYCPITCINVLK